jgi:hypothetical protein
MKVIDILQSMILFEHTFFGGVFGWNPSFGESNQFLLHSHPNTKNILAKFFFSFTKSSIVKIE